MKEVPRWVVGGEEECLGVWKDCLVGTSKVGIWTYEKCYKDACHLEGTSFSLLGNMAFWIWDIIGDIIGVDFCDGRVGRCNWSNGQFDIGLHIENVLLS